MSANVHRLETGYTPEPEKSSSKMRVGAPNLEPGLSPLQEELREEAARIVARYDDIMHDMFSLYRMARMISGDPIQ